jgi:hypothetical protein
MPMSTPRCSVPGAGAPARWYLLTLDRSRCALRCHVLNHGQLPCRRAPRPQAAAQVRQHRHCPAQRHRGMSFPRRDACAQPSTRVAPRGLWRRTLKQRAARGSRLRCHHRCRSSLLGMAASRGPRPPCRPRHLLRDHRAVTACPARSTARPLRAPPSTLLPPVPDCEPPWREWCQPGSAC